MFDVIIVGGSYAGLAAALQLGRARRNVLVLDAGEPRNRSVPAAHGFFGHDGESPDVIRARGRANVLAYETVSLRTELVTQLGGACDDFRVVSHGGEYHARRIILATGVTDEPPAIAGVRERWGQSVFHCPYCDGFERNRGRIGVIAANEHSMHHVVLTAHWAGSNQTWFFLEDAFEPNADQLARLAAHGISLVRSRVTYLDGSAPVTLHVASGDALEVDSVFVVPRTTIRDQFAAQLGCELVEGPLGPHYKVDDKKQTTVTGVFACGDVALEGGYIAYAVADGTLAGAFAHQSLVFP